MTYQIEVSLKKEFRDKHGEHIRHEVSELGVKGISAVGYSSVYKIEGGLSRQEAERIAGRLLIDPITEQYSILQETGPRPGQEGREAIARVVEIWLKKGVTDTVADSVSKAVKDIGINEPLKIKTGHKFVFTGKISPVSLKRVAQKLLYNPMIQECLIRP